VFRHVCSGHAINGWLVGWSLTSLVSTNHPINEPLTTTELLQVVKRSQRSVITSPINLHFATGLPPTGCLGLEPSPIDSITGG